MKKRKIKNKNWHKYRSKKVLYLLSRKKKYIYFLGQKEYRRNNRRHEQKSRSHVAYERIEKIAPEILSVQKNHEKTINFFNEICSIREEYKHEKIEMFINIENVIEVDIDAIMYLLAIIRDTRSLQKKNIRISGNYPKEECIREKFINSGFLNYVDAPSINITPRSKNIKIKTGDKNDPDVAKEVCTFVQSEGGFTRKETVPLYNILVELMGNTNQHAYRNSGEQNYANYWYLFAEKNDDDISFVFLDTGLGIPTTVSKKWPERLPFSCTDADFIYSALEGDFRTETKQKNRGKGLPQIYDCCKHGMFSDMSIFAGKGNCYMSKEPSFARRNYDTKMNGTLFKWKIR